MKESPPTTTSLVFDSLLDLRTHLFENKNDQQALFVTFCAANFMRSPAQLCQDLFVLFMLGHKRDGFFVEFGATDGVMLSNSFTLEKHFGWHGILAEPARCWHEALGKNRTNAIDHRCVWSESGRTLDFSETTNPELSTIAALVDGDFNSSARCNKSTYGVETVSLNDLLIAHNAPDKIDYLSIDTEGSEYEILGSFDFQKHAVDIVTVEHNWREPETSKVDLLLRQNGFVRMFEELSKWDGWYAHNRIVNPAGQ